MKSPVDFNSMFLLFSIYLLTNIIGTQNLYARVHDFETARLKSTAGCGIASILMDEGTLLNPAPLAFYNISSIYASRHTTSFQDPDQSPSNPDPNSIPAKKPSYGLILSDSKNNLKGSLSFLKQKERDEERTRTSISFASVVGPYSALGFTFRHTKDTNKFYSYESREETYNQLVIGATHSLNPELSLGVVVIDPFKSMREDSRFILGAQYMVYKIIILMADFGSDYNDDLSKGLLYRAAIQLNFFSDLYVRVGGFNDKKLEEKGSGFGLGWITPNFILDLGIKNTTQNYSQEKRALLGHPPTKMKELSFGLGIKF